MAIKFGDLYEEYIALEEAISRMEIDIDNADCDSITKCRLLIELGMLQNKLANIESTEFDFEKLNFTTIVESIERCMHCVEFAGDMSDISPPPSAVASTCGNRRIQLNLSDIEEVRIFEVTSGTTPVKADKYEFTKNAFPYEILTRASEKYVATYDTLRNGISIKGFNRAANKAVSGFGNISKVEVKLNPVARAKYGIEWVTACKVLLTTPTPMNSASPLTNAVDGNELTCPVVATTSQPMVELVFQFFV